MKKKTKLSSYFAMLILAVGTSSCVNEAYDLNKDIDLTIQAGGDSLALPIGSTENIKLGDVLELDNDSLIQVDKISGSYFLQKKSEEAISEEISVKTFTARLEEPAPVSAGLSFEKIDIKIPELKIKSLTGILPPGLDIDELLDKAMKPTYTVELSPEKLNADFSTKGINNEVPEEITSITSAEVEAGAHLTLSLSQEFASEVTLENFKIRVPSFLKIKGGTFLEDKNGRTIQEYNLGTFSLNNETKKEIDIIITGIDLSLMEDGQGFIKGKDQKKGKIEVTDSVAAYGSLTVKKEHINTEVIKKHFDNLNTYDNLSYIPNITVTLNAEFDEIKVNSVSGMANPDIDISVNPVKITGIPNFLQDNDVQLDLDNPQVRLSLWNDTPADIKMSCNIHAYKDGKLNSDTPIHCDLTIDRQKTTGGWSYLCLAEKEPKDLDPKFKWVHVSNLSDLLIPSIPDELRFDIDAEVIQNEIKLELGRAYKVSVEYEMYAPFSFGEKFKIVYSDTINGWNESLEKLNLTAIDLTGTIKNDIPLDLLLTAKAVSLPDVNGNVKELKEVTTTVKTNAGNTIPGASQTPMTIEIRSANLEALHQVDGLIYRIEGASNEKIAGKELNENQCLKIDNLRLMVLGGITIDLNK